MWFPILPSRFLNPRARRARPRRRAARARSLRCEPLERRVMLDSTTFAGAVAVDASDNIYVTGNVGSWVDFDPGPGESWAGNPSLPGYQTGYLAKYAPDKSLQWALQPSGADFGYVSDVAVDTLGYVYVSGSFRGSMNLGSIALSAATNRAFAAKLDSNGNVLWAAELGDGDSIGTIGAGDIALDESGNVYVYGLFRGGTTDFDPTEGVAMLTAQGQDAYVVQLKADGSFGWATGLGTSDAIWTFALGADSTGVYATGEFTGAMYLGSAQDLVNPAGTSPDGYVVKFDAIDGSVAWTKQYTHVGVGALRTAGGFVYAAAGDCERSGDGVATGREFLAKYEPDGDLQWSKAWPGVVAYDIAVRGNSLYLTGTFTGTVDFDPGPQQFNLTSSYRNIIVSKMSDAGDFVWAGQMGGPSAGFLPNDRGTGIAVDSAGNVVTAGVFFGARSGGSFTASSEPVDFDPGPGTATLPVLGIRDAFVSNLVPAQNGGGLEYGWAFQLGTYEKFVDDGQAGYTEIGSGWKTGKTTDGYTRDWRYPAKGTGANKAQWTFSGLPAGQYEVFATWVAQNNNATNAQDAINGVNAAPVNQRVAPNLMLVSTPDTCNGVYVQSLGVVSVNSGTITVTLSDKANGVVVADAIRVIIKSPAGPSAPLAGPNGVAIAEPATLSTSSIPTSTDAAFSVLADDPLPIWPATANPAMSAPAKVRVAHPADAFSQDDLLDDLLGIADEL